MRKIDEIIIHCTATLPGSRVGVAEVRAAHRARGFCDIGYHYLVLPDGTVEAGRREERSGAHCLGHNRRSIGVAYVGGLDASGRPADTRTPEQKKALAALVAELLSRYPSATIHGHREFAAKACPCFDVAEIGAGL